MKAYLSIGQISTLIAFVVFVAGFVLPNAFSLILVRFLSKTPNATTWGFVQRALASSDWPTLLQKDSVSTNAVEWKVRWLSWVRLGMVTLLAVAAVITPAGLYDRVVADTSPSPALFQMLPDEGAFGRGTLRHHSVPWRTCKGSWNRTFINVPCPGDTQSYTIISNASGNYQDWDGDVQEVAVKTNRAKIYQSGLANFAQTVSSYFDIQSRRIRLVKSTVTANFSEVTPVTTFNYLKNAVARDDIYAVDGLIVDARAGQIGFRNHTVPQNSPTGMVWQEDLLFAEADTSCVDLGISIVFDLPYLVASRGNDTTDDDWLTNGVPYSIVDDGGFANLDPQAKPQQAPASQDQPNLQSRAEAYSYWARYWTMSHPAMNLSDSRTGQPDPSKSAVGRAMPARQLNSFVELPATDRISAASQPDIIVQAMTGSSVYDNSTSTAKFRNLTRECNPFQNGNLVHLNMFPIRCGLLFGAAVQLDGTPAVVAQEGMSMRRKIFSCASAVKLSIKTTHFRTNVTGPVKVEDIKIDSIEPKQYDSTDKQPLWGMETPSNTFAGNIIQLWGLLSDEYANTPNISTSRAAHFYPSYQAIDGSSTVGAPNLQYLPASTGWSDALSSAYEVKGQSYDDFRNGRGDLELLARWQNLSQDANAASQVFRLLFTDIAANYFTSGRGWLSQDIVPPPYSNVTTPMMERTVPVHSYHRQVFYRWAYGVPALVTIALLLLLIPVTVLFACTGSITTIGKFLPMLSAGRLLTSTESQGQYDESYKKWADGHGTRQLAIQGWSWAFTSPSPQGTPAFNTDEDSMHSDTKGQLSKKDYAVVSQHERPEFPPSRGSEVGPGPSSESKRRFLGDHEGY